MRSAPDYIQFYPTIRCNLKCSFCFNRSLSPVKDMAFADFQRMLDKLKAIGVRTIDIIGGEPTMYADLPRMIKSSLQEDVDINLSSNGTDILQLNSILDHYPRANVGISIHDRKLRPGVEDLVVKRHPIVKMVAGRLVDDMLVKRLLALKPKKFYLLYMDALEPGQLKDTVPFDSFWSHVHGHYDRAKVGIVACSGFLPDYERYPELLKARCPAGTTKLGVMPDGSVYPYNLFFGKQEFMLGNIFTDPFESIWNHGTLTFFRTFSGNACPRTTCELHSKCHGGCPAHSYAHSGKRSAPEPRCVPG